MRGLKFSIFLFILALVFTPFASATIDDALLSINFDNTLTDDGSGAHTFTNNSFSFSSSNCVINECGDFVSASNTWVLISGTDLKFNGATDDVSVSAWIYLDNDGSNDEVIDARSADNNGWFLSFDATTGAPRFQFAGGSTPRFTTATAGACGISTSTLHHVVAIANRTGDLKGHIYVDGVECSSYTAQDNLNIAMSSSNNAYIGRKSHTGSDYFDGRIDQLIVYDRVLTFDEVTELYNSGAGVDPYAVTPPAENYSHIKVLDQYDSAGISGLTVYQGAVSNTTDGTGTAYFYNHTTGLNYTVDGGLNYFNISGTATQNTTNTVYTYGARYNLTAINIANDTISSFSVNTTGQYNSTAAGWLWLYLKPNTTITLNYSAAGYANASFNVNTGSRDIGAYEATLQYDVNLTVKANNSLNTTQAITGLCVRIEGGSVNTTGCNTTGTDVYFNQLFPQATYNVTVYSAGVGDGVNAQYSSNKTQYAISASQVLTLYVTPLTLGLTFRDEETRALLTGTNITVSVIDSASNTVDYQTNTSTITIQNNLTEGDYTVRYSAANYSLREFYFTLSYTDPVTNETLYLLRQSVYSPGTVSVRNFDGTNVANAQVTMSRYYGNDTIPNQVQSGTTDSNGDVIFVAESVTAFYTFKVTVNGTVVYTETVPNLLTVDSTGLWSKTIVLLRTGTDAVSAYTGFSYNFTPQGVLYNNTNQTFTFSVYSYNWTVTQCYFYLYGETSGLLNSTSGYCGNNGGTASLTYNIITTEKLYTQAIVGTLLFNNTYEQNYYVIVQGNGTFTLAVLFDDIKAFSGNGFNDFTRFLLAVIIIMAVTFSLSSRSNYINNPEEILFLMFLLSVGFSYIGWLDLSTPTMPVQAVGQYFVSLLLGMAAIFAALKKQGVIGSG